MVDPSKALAVMKRCIDDACKFWGLGHKWEINYKCETLEQGEPANCTRLIAYLKAYIDLDPAQCADLAEVWQLMAHEMGHVVAGEMDVYKQFVEKGQDVDEKQRFAWEMGIERVVTTLERTFIRHNRYPGDEAFTQIEAT